MTHDPPPDVSVNQAEPSAKQPSVSETSQDSKSDDITTALS